VLGLLWLGRQIGRAILRWFLRHEVAIDAALTVSGETHGMALGSQSCGTPLFALTSTSPFPLPKTTHHVRACLKRATESLSSLQLQRRVHATGLPVHSTVRGKLQQLLFIKTQICVRACQVSLSLAMFAMSRVNKKV
jgi:hypothetical protein